MSDAAAGDTGHLNLADLVDRIERQQEETRKFVAEQRKLNAERDKQHTEAAKLTGDRAVVPWQLMAVFLAAGSTLFGAGAAFWHVMGR